MDEERRRKIEAGKSKWAEFKRKKSRNIKSNSCPDRVLSNIQEKSCPADPGGTEKRTLESAAVEKSNIDISSDSEGQYAPVHKLVPTKCMADKNESPSCQVTSMKDSSPPEDEPSSKQHISIDSPRTALSRSTIGSSFSVESFLSEGTIEDSETSSGSDNSTITGNSESSKSDSTAENSSSENSPCHAMEKETQIIKMENSLEIREDNVGKLPLQNIIETKSPYFVVAEEDNSENTLVMHSAAEGNCQLSDNTATVGESISFLKLLGLNEAEDNPIPLLNTAELVSLCHKKFKKFQEAIQQRDSIIAQLSYRLELSMNASDAANTAGNNEVELLKDEINLLHKQMRETSQLVKIQKSKNGSLEVENSSCQTEVTELIKKCESAIQVETNLISSFQSCDLKNNSINELLCEKGPTNSESLHETVLKLHEFLMSHFSSVHIIELMTLLRNDISFQGCGDVPESVANKNDLQSGEQIDTAVVLKKIMSLNMVAKFIESLISISSGDANEALSDFSPSKFQSFFLKRLHSVETGDILPDASENESVVSDYNFEEMQTPCTKPSFESSLSIEQLRRRNIAEDFSLVTEFLQDEMLRVCSFIPSMNVGPQGDGFESQEMLDEKESATVLETDVESDHKKILLHKSKLEGRLKNLKLLDKELHGIQSISHQISVDSDTMTMSEDMMEEPCIMEMSCISLLSLTDSEYKGENIATDSETNLSRKVSMDMTRSMQERDFCIRCERHFDLLKEKYENEMLNLKASLESSYSAQKNEFLESMKALESDIDQLKIEKEKLNEKLNKHVELLCSENEKKIVSLSGQYNKELSELKISQNKYQMENEELDAKVRELEEKLTHSNRSIVEKAEIEIALQNQIADLIQEHEQDIEALRLEYGAKLELEKKQLKNNYQSSFDVLKKVHEDEIIDVKCQIKKEYEEKEQNLLNEHSKTINMIEAAHCDESAIYQKKIEQLLEEKCELLSKTTHEYETILKKNHRALVILCRQLLSKINAEKERVINESLKSGGCDFDTSFSDVFEHLNKSLENGLVRFLNQNYFMNSNEEFCPDETEYLPIELNYPISNADLPLKIEIKESSDTEKKDTETKKARSCHDSLADSVAHSESSLDSDDLNMFHTEINKLQEEFQKDVAMYKDVNNQLHQEIRILGKQVQELEEQKENLEIQLQEKEKELVSKDSLLNAMDAAVVKGGTQLSATDIRSWQVQTAQTNSRLLHVLSDLVKTFLDIENDINSHLLEYGLIPPRSGALNHHDDDTGQSVGSREDFNSLSLGECPNLDLSEDGPDLTPRAWDVFITGANYDTDLEGEDVVLGASRRLRMAVDHVLNLLSRALENHQNQDLKLLLKRNEELSNELQEESQGRDAVHMELVTAESTVRKLESEKQRLEDLNRDLKDEFDMLKRELSIERSKMSHLEQEKESAYDEIHILKEQCELMASRLGDPEKTENGKMLNSSGTCMHENSELLQENSRLSSEKQTVQKNLSKERQSFLDRLHQMEIELEELTAEKDDLVEQKCKEIRDLKAEMEAMEKQLQSNRKFIEQQAQEREQEREDFIKEINKMQDFVREKEKIQSTETQLTKEIESLEQLLRARIEDHKNVMAKKDEVEKELRQSLDKIKDLREVIEALEKQLDLKSRIETELRHKLSNICESIPNEVKNNNSDTDSAKNVHINGEANEQLHNLKEQLASRSQEIESMSQSQTLLHELRGQIHFLEAKVEQRARLLETSILSSSASSPVQSGATSPSGSQDSESLQIPCEDGWEMSPRSIHWLEVRRLEEKIGRLAHIDEELLKKNKELEQQLKRMKSSYSECQHENVALQEKLSEQLMQISALKSHIDEQKHKCSTPQRTHSFTIKIEELQEELEKKTESNKRLMSDLQDAQSTVNVLQEDINQKNEMVAILQKCAESNAKQDTSELDSSYDFSSIEDIQNQLTEKIELMKITEKENDSLKSDIECLKTENSSLKSLLRKTEAEVDAERAQVETLYKEMGNLAENCKESVLSSNNSNSNDTNELKEEKQGSSPRLASWENRLKAKNLEILMLKATVTKLETTLRVRERDLELEQKRLEQDFNTVQDMMQQKERELATLHEETEAQLKLEAQIESLDKELKDQREVETHLREKIQHLETELNLCKNLIVDNEKRDLSARNLEEKIQTLEKQLEFLKKFNAENEYTNIEELTKKIMEAANIFKINEMSGDTFREILSDLLKNAVDSIAEQLKQQHDEHVNAVETKWQDKINEEISSKDRVFQSENEKLQKTYHSKINKLSAEKDAFWQEKVNTIELQLKNEQVKYERLCNSSKGLKEELKGMYTNEINTLRQNMECALKEKVSLESIVKDLKNEMEQMKLAENNQSSQLSKDYDSKLSAISKTIKETFEKEKEKIIALHQQKICHLQRELDLKLEQEKDMKTKHKEELTATQKYFENCWATEMKKIKDFQSEDRKKLKDSSEKILEDRLKKAKEDFALHIAEEKKEYLLQHKHELEQLQEKFEKEKKLILEMKEKAVEEVTDMLEKNFNSKLTEIRGKLSSQNKEKSQRKWEEENLQLISSHRKQISALKQELKNRYEKQLQAQAAAHSAEIQRLQESYNMKVEEVHDMINEAKRAASKTGCPDCGSHRTTTPSSDMTSSDEACSSCQEDMLAVNKHILVDKIHQDGKRVLSLIESSAQPLAAVKEAHLWLEERRWIINKLKAVIPATSNENLKMIISNLVDEVQKFRVNFETALEENSDMKQKFDDLEHQLTIQYSKLCDAQLQVKKQKETNEDLELLLSSKTAELSDLRKRVTETNRYARLTAEKETFTPNSGSSGSSYEIGCLRSADEPRSAEKFSLYMPDIENTPSMERTPKNKAMHPELETIPKIIDSPLISPREENVVLDGMSKVKEKLLAVLNKGTDTTDAKLHGLYWVYRRSHSYNKALIYQKRYLLMLLKGFLLTENATLACLNQMNFGRPPSRMSNVTDSSLHGRSRFRSAVFVLIALQRMKFYVRRWRLLARIPSSHVINIEIQSVFQNYSFLSPAISPGIYHMSSHSLASAPTFVGDRDYKSSQVSTSSRSENKFKNSANPDRSQLIEYVHRLEILQKQLGLDNCR